MHRLRTLGILTALAVFIAACTGPTPPTDTNDLTVAIQGNGSVTFDIAGGDDAEGTSSHAADADVTLVATADDGWTFAGWTGDCTGTDATCVVTMDGDRSVTATFTETTPAPTEVTVNVDFAGSTGSGTVTSSVGHDCSFDGTNATGTCTVEAVPTDAAVTFTATPGADTEFDGWAGDAADCGTDANCEVTPSKEPFLVTAVFRDATLPEPTSGTVSIANTEDDGFEWRGDASGASGNGADVEGNTYNNLRQIGLSYMQRYGVEVVSGFAFRDLDIPAGAEIVEAYIQFTSIVRDAGSGPTGSYSPTDGNPVTVTIAVEDNLSPAPIPQRDDAPYPNNLTGRATVADTTVAWPIEPWPARKEATAAQRTPDLSGLLQALVDKEGWTQGDSDVMFIISNADDSPDVGWRQIADYSETGTGGEVVPAGTYAAVLHYRYR